MLYNMLNLLYKQIKRLINISSNICLSYRVIYKLSSENHQLILIRKVDFLRLTIN